jgi:orotate phosphoribosyltransferase
MKDILESSVPPRIDVEALFRKAGVLREGHFLLTSGLHSPVYWEKFRILQYPDYTGVLCGMIADRFRGRLPSVACSTVELLRNENAVKEGNTRVLRRDFVIEPGEKVLVVDDVLTTGKSVHETLDAVRSVGGDVIGVGVMVDRSESLPDFGAELFSCVSVVRGGSSAEETRKLVALCRRPAGPRTR